MRILFVNSYAFLPQVVGGIEVSTLDLCKSIQEQGHDVAVLCSLSEKHDALWLKNRILGKLHKKEFPLDHYEGVRVYRGWSSIRGLQEATQQERPDAIIVQGGGFNAYEIAGEAARLGFKTFFYAHDIGVISSGAPLPDLTNVRWIANSAFTAKKLYEYIGAPSTTIPLIFALQKYRVKAPGNRVTMINPRPEKGGDIAIEVAETCSDIHFQFVEAWSTKHPAVLQLKARAAKLPNVSWIPSHNNMKKIYAQTRVLFMPSQCQETWGRVITEAQFSGIPALASKLGALPETVGEGGVLLPADAPAQQWAQALRQMYHDAATYKALSEAALSHSLRSELAPVSVTKKLLELIDAN